jgi:hypothetical protein
VRILLQVTLITHTYTFFLLCFSVYVPWVFWKVEVFVFLGRWILLFY